MPRTDDAKNWQPSDSDQKLIDRMTDYLVVAERCLSELRKFDASYVQGLWLELQLVFYGDRVKYPSAMAAQDDIKGKRQNARQFAFRPRLVRLVVPKSEPLSTVLAYITI